MQLNDDLKANPTDAASPLFGSPMHFVGHSRGTVVNSEIIQRLGTYFRNIPGTQNPLNVRMTTLDPHDLNQPSNLLSAAYLNQLLGSVGVDIRRTSDSPFVGITSFMSSLATNPLGLVFYDDFQDPNVQRWENVSFADNYYQILGNQGFSGEKTITPNGRLVENFDLNVSLSQDIKQGLPGRSGFTQDDWSLGPFSFGIGGPHSRVWRWYAGTVNLGIDHFESSEAKEPIFRRLLLNYSQVKPHVIICLHAM